MKDFPNQPLKKSDRNEKQSLILPSISSLGVDLLRLTRYQLFLTLFLPLASIILYFIFAFTAHWVWAVLSVMAFSFFTYGSTSHDLVHRNLGLNKFTNDFLLFFLEVLSIRSGHAYRLAHLYHHATYPHPSDIEGAAAGMSFLRTMGEGLIFQVKIGLWAWKHAKKPMDKKWILLESTLCLLFIVSAIWLLPVTPIFLIYVLLMIMGSWIIPLVTSYIPHQPQESNVLFQTKLFRGRFFSLIALEHLYHLEHHLYPAVPHRNWVKLAKRLDPYLEKAGIQPMTFLF
ncbi:MAG: fatty acid desaturase [Bacteroidota bacterium]